MANAGNRENYRGRKSGSKYEGNAFLVPPLPVPFLTSIFYRFSPSRPFLLLLPSFPFHPAALQPAVRRGTAL